ncbi:centriole and centriolar satellite protein OFD1 isoform 2-T3 [Discoglossus pictus]
MSSREMKSLSQEEMRKRLYQTFKNKGVLDSLKTQLRNQLICELKQSSFSGEPAQLSEDADSLLHKASNSLVADHLRRCGYEYSLSVFYPECGLEKMLTVPDILQLMKINPKSGLYKSLTSSLQQGNTKGFLFQLLTEITYTHLHREGRDADTQTVTTSQYKESIVEKLQFIDEQFEEIYPKRQKFESLENKLTEYRKEIEEQLRTEMSQKLQHFKDVEIAKIKLQEKEKSQKEMSDFRRELEKTYQIKTDGLVSREKNAIERLQRQQEIEAKEIYAQRQALLKDIEIVRNRETDFRQRTEAFELAQKLQEEKNKSMNDLLKKRELEVKNNETTFDQKLKNELLRHEIELKEEYLKRTQNVRDGEKRNKEDAAKLREEAIVTNMKKQELEQALSRTKDLEIEVDSLKAQLSLLARQNHHLTDKLKEAVDYPLIKEEKVELHTQAKLLKKQLEEVHKENQLLRERTTYPTPECVALQAELKRVENARNLDREEFKSQKEILEKQLQSEVERCAETKSQLLDTEGSVKRLQAQVEQLELQLLQTRLALENEVYRNPKPSLVDRSVLDYTSDKIVPHDIYVDKAVLKSQLLFDSFVEAGGSPSPRYRKSIGSYNSSTDSDTEFVTNTKARIRELEKEAEYLEEAYCNYQHRVIHGGTQRSSLQDIILPHKGLLKTVSSALPHKVTFSESNLSTQQQILLTQLKTQKYERDLSTQIDKTPLQARVPSLQRLSSTPISKSDRNSSSKEKVFLEDNDGSYISSSHHSPNNRISPIPKVVSAYRSEAPDSEKQQLSSHSEPAADLHEGSDYSKPQILNFEDLHHSDSSLQDQEDIPEQLENILSSPFEKVGLDSNGATNVLAVVSSPPDSLSSRLQHNTELPSKPETAEESNRIGTQEDFEEQQREYDILENKKGLQEYSMAESKKAEDQGQKVEGHTEGNEPKEAKTASLPPTNPLDKYMQMILQNRAEQQSEKVSKESLEEISIEEKLSNGSITAHSHGDADEDFW